MTVTNQEIQALIHKLPKPVAEYRVGSVSFEIYRAKDMYTGKWRSPILKKIVKIARISYSRYGSRVPFDLFDKKAAIYLVRSTYTIRTNKNNIQEWLSVRMVPGDGLPVGAGELEIYESRGESADVLMCRFLGKDSFWSKMLSSSRMCGIHPYSLNEKGNVHGLAENKHKYTSISFALIHRHFLLDYPLDKFPFEYVTAIIRPDFYKKALKYSSKGKKYLPEFTAAHNTLNIGKEEVMVDRNIYSYNYPTYWFDSGKLLKFINYLRIKNNKSPLMKVNPKVFSGFPSDNKEKISFSGIKIKPQELQKHLERSLSDMPELKITKVTKWYLSMDVLLKVAGISQITH